MKKSKLYCPFCGKEYLNKTSLDKHAAKHNSRDPSDREKPNTFPGIYTQENNLRRLKQAITSGMQDLPIEFYINLASKHKTVFELLGKLLGDLK